jgi:Tol biopolymer transport system component
VGGEKIAEYASKIANEELERIEYTLEDVLQRRVIFIIYNKQSEFKQSNIGLVTGSDEYNIGGVTRIVENKVFIYYEGDHNKLKRQIRASIAEILVNEMLYGGNFRNRASASAMLNLPEWYIPGLISYIAYDTDFDTEAKIKTAILKTKSQKIHRLYGEDAKIAGHSFWRYLSETYGESIVSQIVYMTRITKSVPQGFMYVLGVPLKDVLTDWFYFYRSRYEKEVSGRDSVLVYSKIDVVKTKRKYIYNQIKMSPNGKYITYVTNQRGQYKIWLYDTETQKIKRLLKRENKLDQILDLSYPILTWHPSGEFLTFITERKGHIWLNYYNTNTEEFTKREVFYLDKVLDYNFSADGQNIVISAVENGVTDIFVFSVVAGTFENITNDIADDINPKFIGQSNDIIFSSNRKVLSDGQKSDQEIQDSYDIFLYSAKDKSFTQLTSTEYVDEVQPIVYEKDKYFFLTNKNGINNKGIAQYDSVISFIDTAIHYRNFSTNYTITNQPFSINCFDYNKKSNLFANSVSETKQFSVYTDSVEKDVYKPVDLESTWFRTYYIEKKELDSLLNAEIDEYKVDSVAILFRKNSINDTLVDINNYIFEIEKREFLEDEDKFKNIFKLPKQLVYFTNFYSNLMVTQVDFGFMNQSYQAFTGSAFYFNPGFNLLTKVGIVDLFEDYKITGGIRFSLDFESNEYLVSVEDLKKRLDKQYIYHRQVFESATPLSYSKIFTNEFMSVFKYPITQIHALRATVSARFDEQVYKSLDQISLHKDDDYKVWGGLKGEYILDNTRKLGINLYDGTRLKLFGEYYNQIGSGKNSHLFVVGADIRNYIHIHRGLVFATRFAYSTSFGESLLMYYLGGVDNWMNLSRKTPTFDYYTRINRDKNWVFQAVATNMRGFVQNVRNGNSFAVTNVELRWPIVRYVFNRPISNDFLNNFMIIGFTDVGSAWEGFNPVNAVNAYDYKEINQKPISVLIDRKRSPLVAGVGFGLRSRLLGYYIRTDWAWGIDGGRVLPYVFYLSLCTDF